MATAIALVSNGRSVYRTVDDPQMPLLYALRNDLGSYGRASAAASPSGRLHRAFDGKALRSCVMRFAAVATQKFVTLKVFGAHAAAASAAAALASMSRRAVSATLKA